MNGGLWKRRNRTTAGSAYIHNDKIGFSGIGELKFIRHSFPVNQFSEIMLSLLEFHCR